jgi:hypothetical protein
VDEEQLNDGDGESESSGLTNAERNAAIAVPVIVGGVALIALAVFVLHRSSRPKTSHALPTASSSSAAVPAAPVTVASTELSVLPPVSHASDSNAASAVVVHVQ